MKVVSYEPLNPESGLSFHDREPALPGPGEVRVHVVVSGVNPTDWKHAPDGLLTPDQLREAEFDEIVPNHDGAGVIDMVGSDVTDVRMGDRVWIFLAQIGRPTGTAQEQTVVPASRTVRLPDGVSFELGACLGVPAMTAHRLLTVHGHTRRLHRGALSGQTILVAGGAGAVGHAAIQLAVWAGATVITTISGPAKATLAKNAGAHHVLNYRDQDITEEVLRLAPAGVDQIIEVSPSSNIGLDVAVVKNNGCIAYYADDGGGDFSICVLDMVTKNIRLQAVLLATLDDEALTAAADDITAALQDGALPVGEQSGLPLTWFGLSDTAAAHAAVKAGAVGKVLIAVDPVAVSG